MVSGTEEGLLRLIPLLPLAGATYHGLMLSIVRRSTPRLFTIAVSCGAVLLSFAVSCVVFWNLLALPRGSRILVDNLYTWIGAGVGETVISADMAFQLDPLSGVVILVVTGVGSLIHIYSIGYMDNDQRDDKGFQRFFCYLNLFMFSMLILVLADNFVLMFLGWEGVGLCSYLLVGFWYSDRHNAYCGSKAFIVNRIGDFALLVGIFFLFSALVDVGAPGIAFQDVARHFDKIATATVTIPEIFGYGGYEWLLVDVVGICFFIGACGKSAQLPLHVWLPDAMAGPTPVSALIHAATMVTAGVYLVCRMSFLYAVAPTASAVVAWTGAITAVFAATVAITQTDIKKVLAYSTMSQLGYMFLAAGCGGYSAAVFHLSTHAFFKALLFLSAGAVILSTHHQQDILKMGGLYRQIPFAHWVFFIGVLVIAGFPGLSGFFSKDEILVAAYTSEVPGHMWLYGIGLLTTCLTALYMFRLHFLVFYGESRLPVDIRESMIRLPKVILYPLGFLAFLSLFFGWAGLPQVWGDTLFGLENSNSFENFLLPMFATGEPHVLEHSVERLMAAATIVMGLVGFALAWFFYMNRIDLPARIAASAGGMYRLLRESYYVDAIYDAVIVRPLVAFSDRLLFRTIDTKVIDDLVVNGTARTVRAGASSVLKFAQTGLAQSYVFFMIAGAVAVVGYLLT